MKKLLPYIVAIAMMFSLVATANAAESATDLELGSVETYAFDGVKVHAYQANDGLGDEAILLETDDALILIDPPSFVAQLDELDAYIAGLGKEVTDLVLAYHPFGGDRYVDAKVYKTEAIADASADAGMGAGFVAAFGDAFAATVPETDELLAEGEVSIGGVDMTIYPTEDGADIAIPAIHAIFVHMNGENTHSIIGSIDEIDGWAAKLQSYVDAGYAYVFTSHDRIETASALTAKIDYLNQVKEIAAASSNAEEFTNAMNEAFPNYGGENYLAMTVAALFSEGDAAALPDNVVAKQIGDLTLYSFLSDSVSPVIVARDNLVLIDYPGDNEEKAASYVEFVQRLGKPIERMFISHIDAAHWVNVEKFLPDVALYSVDADEIMATPEGAALAIAPIADGDTLTVDGVQYTFETNREIGAWEIKMPALNAVYVDHLGYVNLHVLLAPLEPRAEMLKALEAEGYTWFMPGHSAPAENPGFVAQVETYYNDVSSAVANNEDVADAVAEIVEKYPDYNTPEMLELFLPEFYQ